VKIALYKTHIYLHLFLRFFEVLNSIKTFEECGFLLLFFLKVKNGRFVIVQSWVPEAEESSEVKISIFAP
jgi:hypothetical protein